LGSRYDVIVIGSGPAGASAAYALARAELRTLMLEKEKLPRYKPCGGGLTAKVANAVDFDLAPMIEATITRARLAYKNRPMVDLHFPQPAAWCVMRDKFDHHLAQRAVQAGAELHDAEGVNEIAFDADHVAVRTRAGEYHAEVIVGADGAHGITRKAAQLHASRNLAAALEVEMEVPPAEMDIWRNTFYLDFGAIPYGYGWIFPKADHLSVGIGRFFTGSLFPSFQTSARGGTLDLRAEFKRWTDGEPTLREHRDILTRGHLLPLGGREIQLHNTRVVLAGDAGGLIDPFLGEGIYYAIRSGTHAGQVIAEAFRREDLDLSEYTARVNGEFAQDFRTAKGLADIFYRMPHLGLWIVAHSRTIQNSLAGVVDGSAGYKATVLGIIKKYGRKIVDKL
jgi:geranylgeranyl reductase family protein